MAKEEKKLASTPDQIECKEVEILGGFKHPEKGFFVEIESTKLPRQTISVWKIKHDNQEKENNFFLKLFGVPVEIARTICAKRGQLIWQWQK